MVKITVRGDKYMNKEKFSKILKTKGFYLSLLTGALAIAAISFVVVNTSVNNDDSKKLTELNQNPITEQADNEQKNSEEANVPEEDKSVVSDNTTSQDTEKVAANDKKTADTDPDLSDKKLTENKSDKKTADTEKSEESVATSGKTKTKETKLSFSEDADLEWPVSGDIIIPYDIEHGVQFLTLGQYKCSDAIVISSKVGAKVKSATKAKVLSIDKDEELGLTVTTDIGSGYKVIYGQLKDVKVKEGETIAAGKVIGQVAEPTKYYVVEGPNLYFKVTQDDESVNPMYLLK